MESFRLLKFFGVVCCPTLFVLVPFVSTSCEVNDKFVGTDIGGLNNYFNYQSLTNELLVKEVWKIKNSNDEIKKNLLKQKTILLSSGAKVNDQSFNQSAWEAVSKFSKEIDNRDNSYFETFIMNQSNQNDAYDYALAKNYNIWILTGFQQANFLKTWLKIGRNNDKFIKNNIKVIAVDWYNDSLVKKGRILGLNFRTQEASFVASYGASQLLYKINQEDSKKFVNPYFSSFGGADFSGITNFNYGFYEGLRQFNEDVINNYKVSSNKIYLDTGFASTPDARNKVKNIVDGDDSLPQVILPVAGALTANTIDAVKEKKSNQWVVGVDTDQSLAFPNDKKYLLTSIEKRISIAVYKALVVLYGLSDYDDNVMNNFLGNDHFINDRGLIVNKTTNELENFNVEGGYLSGFVGISKSTLDSNLKLKNGKTYAQSYDEIVENTWKEFYGSKNSVGRFNEQKTSTNKGLKPSEETIRDFSDAINALNNTEENIKKILALKNVAFGYMTFSNLNNYFNPIINIINRRS